MSLRYSRGPAVHLLSLFLIFWTILSLSHGGSYNFSGGSFGPNVISHPAGYQGWGASLVVTVGIDSSSLYAAEMEIPVQNMISVYNNLIATTQNLVSGSANNIPSGFIDFESVALHELGHALGLGHPNMGSTVGSNSNYTLAMEGSDGIFTFNPGVDGLVGSSDDIRGDDVNLNWFLKSTNNPFTIAGTIDSSTYTRNLIDLPTGHLYSANADRSVAASLGFSNTEAVMQQGSYSDEAQRTLSADDAATLRYAMSGLDEIQGTADDYTFTLVYAGMVSAGGADIVFDFDSSKTGFATCYFSGSFINSSHITTIGADIYFDDSYNWFFNDELAVSGCGPPASGDWIITQDCTLEENSVADANVIVQENVVLTIASGISLDIDFLTHHLKVKNGAKVVIQSDGKIF